MPSDKIDVQNINIPGQIKRVDRAKYEAMRSALLTVLNEDKPGMSQSEFKTALLPLLPEHLFPAGATAGWWSKTVQLDLEAKGLVGRSATKPLRFFKTGDA